MIKNKQRKTPLLTAVTTLAMLALPAHAEGINGADTAFVMISAALVMLMVPAGLALFYGGMTQHKNVLNTVGMNYAAFCLAFLTWCALGYSLVFSPGNMFIGGLSGAFLADLELTSMTGTIPTSLFVLFQGAFAAVAVAIVTGAIIERVRFSFWALFCILWVLLCYAPVAHWVWGGGLFSHSGEMDFAGGTVVHITAGVSGLVLALLLGKRNDLKDSQPYSVLLTVLGSALLWFGWFGFNAGSALAADIVAANAMLVTCVAGSAGSAAWVLAQRMKYKRVSLLGMSTGAVAGLVGITPAAGYVDFGGALAIGAGSGLIGLFAVSWLKERLGYDDALDAFGIHGVVGIFGSLATGLFANPLIGGNAGVFYGNLFAIVPQLVVVASTVVFSAVITIVIFFGLRLVIGKPRLNENVQAMGMDSHYHGEYVRFDLAKIFGKIKEENNN